MRVSMASRAASPSTIRLAHSTWSLDGRHSVTKSFMNLDARSRSRSFCFWSTRLSSLQGEVWSIAQPSARVRLLALPLVQPHPPPHFHQHRLGCCVRSFKSETERRRIECRRQGWGDPALAYDEEKDIFHFTEGPRGASPSPAG